MLTRHFEFWPNRLATTLPVPKTSVYDNLEVSSRRYPEKIAIRYYGGAITYQQFKNEADRIAGYLQSLGVENGDRVLLLMQNSPQFMISFYAILRANAVVVPINPMNITEELAFYIEDCGIKVAIVGQELYDRVQPLQARTTLKHVLVAAYSEYIAADFPFDIPDEVRLPRRLIQVNGVTLWSDALVLNVRPGPHSVGAEDLAVLPYTSGTTGKPKGCMHTHATVNSNTVGATYWSNITPGAVVLTTLPLFHVTGLQHSMSAPVFSGSTMVLMTRWHRDVAGELIQRYGCTHWVNIATMVVDFVSNPKVGKFDLSTLTSIGGGGAPLPEAVGEKLFQITGVRYAEGYGLSETISQTHFNPPDRPKLQCLGIPSFDVDARVMALDSGAELGANEQGELVVNGPQVFKGYWNRLEETESAFIEIAGKRFFRTGDIVKFDAEGYFYMLDRVKRMINAAGFKVWPAEIEALLYQHPAVQQACVIGVPDERRGETVKAYVILQESERDKVQEEDIIDWAKEHMAAYKYPRSVQFVEKLPISASGKILWRKLQEEERAGRNQA
ncbi:MAG: long-chain fatty acid--CoA ligase [Desulfitobacteriaceae bacterium]